MTSFRVTYLSALVSEELPSVVDDLFVCEVGVWLFLTNAQHLPQSDPERPHVAGCGELTLRVHTDTVIFIIIILRIISINCC